MLSRPLEPSAVTKHIALIVAQRTETMPFSQPDFALLGLFHPHALDQIGKALVSGRPFVHYTTAETALKIIESRQFIMRRASLMNDYKETKHGVECLDAVWDASNGLVFRGLINESHRGLAEECKAHFDASVGELLNETFITSISQHLGGEEDQHGRLSMWRAYGYPTGVGLVLNPSPLLNPSGTLNAYVSPVGYFRADGVVTELRRVNDNILRNQSRLKAAERELVRKLILNMLQFAAICLKHPGFMEEREWRVVWSPLFGEPVGFTFSDGIVPGEKVGQLVMRNEFGLKGVELNEFVQKIIVGPTEAPEATRSRLIAALTAAGVSDPASRVIVSDIPLRAAQRGNEQ